MDQLTLIINTLGRVEVRGVENLSRLLGCIRELERLRDAPGAEKEAQSA